MSATVIIPCLNEEKTVGICIQKALDAFNRANIDGEIIVVDNGSNDRSIENAEQAGGRVIIEKTKGYGHAILRGVREAAHSFIIVGDADNTYNFSELEPFFQKLQNGADLVIGNRFGGTIHNKAMPALHRWFGTPLLTRLLKMFYGVNISDVNCGMRAFNKQTFEMLDLHCGGMEFASEMIIKAGMKKLHIAEVPIDYYPPDPQRSSHLNTFRDGWRHLRIMLILCPKYLFLYPGLIISTCSLLLIFVVHTQEIVIFGLPLGLSAAAFLYAAFFMGIQIALFGVYSIILGNAKGMLEEDRISSFFKRSFSLEKGLLCGGVILSLGLTCGLISLMLIYRYANNLPYVHIPLSELSLISVFIVLTGIQVLFSSFYISLLDLTSSIK